MSAAFRLSVLAMSVTLAACAVGPDFKRPDTATGARFARDAHPATQDASPPDASAAADAAFWRGFGDPALTRRRLVGLLDKPVQHDDPPADQGAEKHRCDSFGALQPKFEQVFTECFGVRLSEVWTERDDAAGQHDVPGSERVGQIQDPCLDGLTAVSDRVAHG